MVVEVSTDLLASADRVWAAVTRPETARRLSRGLVDLRGDALPERWRAGDRVGLHVVLLHLVPLWRQEVEVVRRDDRDLVLETREHGGPVRSSTHRIEVAQTMGPRSRCTDRVELHAGPLTPVLWLGLQVLVRWRHARLRGLVRERTDR